MAAAALIAAPAFAVDVNVGINVPGVAVLAPPPVYVPAPVYVAPRPVYVAPRPVYVAPPAPVYYEHDHGHRRGWDEHHEHHEHREHRDERPALGVTGGGVVRVVFVRLPRREAAISMARLTQSRNRKKEMAIQDAPHDCDSSEAERQ